MNILPWREKKAKYKHKKIRWLMLVALSFVITLALTMSFSERYFLSAHQVSDNSDSHADMTPQFTQEKNNYDEAVADIRFRQNKINQLLQEVIDMSSPKSCALSVSYKKDHMALTIKTTDLSVFSQFVSHDFALSALIREGDDYIGVASSMPLMNQTEAMSSTHDVPIVYLSENQIVNALMQSLIKQKAEIMRFKKISQKEKMKMTVYQYELTLSVSFNDFLSMVHSFNQANLPIAVTDFQFVASEEKHTLVLTLFIANVMWVKQAIAQHSLQTHPFLFCYDYLNKVT